MLNYKKPLLGAVILAVVLIIVTGYALLSNAPPPPTDEPRPMAEKEPMRTEEELQRFVEERREAYRQMAADSPFKDKGKVTVQPAGETQYNAQQKTEQLVLDKLAEMQEEINKLEQELLQQCATEAEASAAAEELIRQIMAERAARAYYAPQPQPLAWPYSGEISATFGPRDLGYHSGIDIAGAEGGAVTAAAAGEVISAGWDTGSYGNCVIIDHGEGLQTYYAHLSAFAVDMGDTVESRQVIGYIGNTGIAATMHLHFEVRVKGMADDPLNYLPAQEEAENV